MLISEPFVNVRAPTYWDKAACCDLVHQLWGREASYRCEDQFIEYFKGGRYAPVFMVATDDHDRPIGFAAYHRTMQCTFNIIWLVVANEHSGRGIGKRLMSDCFEGIEANGGMLVEVITQVPEFYQRLGFAPGQHLGNDWYLLLKGMGEFGL